MLWFQLLSVLSVNKSTRNMFNEVVVCTEHFSGRPVLYLLSTFRRVRMDTLPQGTLCLPRSGAGSLPLWLLLLVVMSLLGDNTWLPPELIGILSILFGCCCTCVPGELRLLHFRFPWELLMGVGALAPRILKGGRKINFPLLSNEYYFFLPLINSILNTQMSPSVQLDPHLVTHLVGRFINPF